MDVDWNTSFINLQNLITISRGDSERMMKYLNQFKELIPDRLDQLKFALKSEDRKVIRQILHKMSPQLQFFGIQDITIPIQRLEFEYKTMPYTELDSLVSEIIYKLEGALSEVAKTINQYFESK